MAIHRLTSPCKGSLILDSTPWIPDLGTGFQSSSLEFGFQILNVSGISDSLSCIPKPRIADSTSKNFPDFPYTWRNEVLARG